MPKDREGNEIHVGDQVRLVQGELGFAHELDVNVTVTKVDDEFVWAVWPAFEGDPPKYAPCEAYDVRKTS